MSVDVERLNVALGDRYTLDRELGRGGMATAAPVELAPCDANGADAAGVVTRRTWPARS
jgi:hypothetical protein